MTQGVQRPMLSAIRIEKYRTLWLAVALYLFVTMIFAFCAPFSLWTSHTPYNHFAWLADAFLHGRLSLEGRPPAYAGGNDFAHFENRWYVVFPPFPALLLLPFIAIVKRVDAFRDGVFFLFVAGIAPAAQFLALQRMRRMELVVISERTALLFSTLFALGTVYFFTAVQGTVWFGAHVVATTAITIYLAASIGARHPLLAGLALCAALGTRSHLGLAGIFFILEAFRVARRSGTTIESRWDWRLIFRRTTPFLLMCGCATIGLFWYNWARFHDPFEVGYRFLEIAWRGRIEKWGMLSYHYLPRNLGVLLTSLPYIGLSNHSPLFQINGHGLALWFTTPIYLWLLWPERRSPLHFACYVTLVLTSLPTLLYQNSGWLQFGPRFSNDYAPWLFALLALGAQRIGLAFHALAGFGVIVNLFGALTFQRQDWNRYYYVEPTQRVIYEPD